LIFKGAGRLSKKIQHTRPPRRQLAANHALDLSDEMIDFFAREIFLIGASLDGGRARPTTRCASTPAARRPSNASALAGMLARAGRGAERAVRGERTRAEGGGRFSRRWSLRIHSVHSVPGRFRRRGAPVFADAASYLGFLKTTLDLYLDRIRRGRYSASELDNTWACCWATSRKTAACGAAEGYYT
jgi:hypothetical protein